VSARYYFSCPVCGNNENLYRVHIDPPAGDWGCFLMLFTGILPYLLFRKYSFDQVQCGRCRHIFQQPAIKNDAETNVAVTIVALLFVGPVLGAIIASYPGLLDSINARGIAELLAEVVRDNAQVVGIAIAVTWTLVLLFCWCFSMYADVKYRRRVGKQFLVNPPEFVRSTDTSGGSALPNESASAELEETTLPGVSGHSESHS